MFGGRQARRTYRVYAEDDFFGDTEDGARRRVDGVEDPDVYGGAPPYTAPSRTLPGPLDGRLGVVLLALVAMAISALVVHLLLASLDGGEAAPRSSLAASNPTASTPGAPRVAPRGDARAPNNRRDRAPGRTSVEASDAPRPFDPARARVRVASSDVRAGASTNEAPGSADAASMNETSAPVDAASMNETSAPVDAASMNESPRPVDVAPASELSAAAPEFGFER